MPGCTEQKIQGRIIKALEARGAYVVKIVTATKAGVADLLVCHAGAFYAMEVKTETGKPRPLQLHHIAKVRQAGGSAGIVRSVDDALKMLGESSY